MVENEEIELIKIVGEKIRLRRLELNLSQEILSYDANIPRNQIGRIERGESHAKYYFYQSKLDLSSNS